MSSSQRFNVDDQSRTSEVIAIFGEGRPRSFVLLLQISSWRTGIPCSINLLVRLYLVWDTYKHVSLKSMARTKRGQIVHRCVLVATVYQEISQVPSVWTAIKRSCINSCLKGKQQIITNEERVHHLMIWNHSHHATMRKPTVACCCICCTVNMLHLMFIARLCFGQLTKTLWCCPCLWSRSYKLEMNSGQHSELERDFSTWRKKKGSWAWSIEGSGTSDVSRCDWLR